VDNRQIAITMIYTQDLYEFIAYHGE